MAKLEQIVFSNKMFFVPCENPTTSIDGEKLYIGGTRTHPNCHEEFHEPDEDRELCPYEVTKNMSDCERLLIRLLEGYFPNILWQGGDVISRCLPHSYSLVWHLHAKILSQTRCFRPIDKTGESYRQIAEFLEFVENESLNKEGLLSESSSFPDLDQMTKIFQSLVDLLNNIHKRKGKYRYKLNLIKINENTFIFRMITYVSSFFSFQVSWTNNSSNPDLPMLSIDCVEGNNEIPTHWDLGGALSPAKSTRIRIYQLTKDDNRFGPAMNTAQRYGATTKGSILDTSTGVKFRATDVEIEDRLPITTEKTSAQKQLIALSRFMFNICRGVPLQPEVDHLETIGKYIDSIALGIGNGLITKKILKESRFRLIGALCLDPNLFFKHLIFPHKAIEDIFPNLTFFRTQQFLTEYNSRIRPLYLDEDGKEVGLIRMVAKNLEQKMGPDRISLNGISNPELIVAESKQILPKGIGNILKCLGENRKLVPDFTGRLEPIFWMFEYVV